MGMSPEYMKYLLEHDTVHGRFPGTVELSDTGLVINGLPVTLSATRDPTEIPWSSAGVEYVCESTGAFTTTEGCMKHIDGGAKKVIISAPAKDADTPTIVGRQHRRLRDIYEGCLMRFLHHEWPCANSESYQ